MKRILLFILTLQMSVFLNAQTVTYQPFHGNFTNYGYHTQAWNGSEVISFYDKTVWDGDTSINGETYTRTYQGGVYFGGVREDVANQQRYFIGLNDVEQNISISHFLEVGDTLSDSIVFMTAFRSYHTPMGGYPQYDTLIVNQVDSVLEASGNYSKTYYFQRTIDESLVFTFNTYRGLLNFDQLEFHINQSCYTELDPDNPPSTINTFCDLTLAEDHLSEIVLYPNPSTETLHLSEEENGFIQDAAIYDFQGNLLKQIPLTMLSTGISIKELNDGAYFLSLNQNRKVLLFQKI